MFILGFSTFTVSATSITPDAKAAVQNNTALACEFSPQDSAWINQAIKSWHYTNKTITQISDIGKFDVVFYDSECQRMSHNALSVKKGVNWISTLHKGMVQLPDGDEMPPMVNSFTSSSNVKDGKTFFVMSAPSVWQQGGVKSKLGLERFMVPVMLHEAMHAIQSPTYGKKIELLTRKHNLSDNFNDDSVQKLFENNVEFSESVQSEIKLLMQAALAPTDAEARKLALQARDKIKNRYHTWMSGDALKYRDIDDAWLTMEGSGQWVGYSWLKDAKGGALSKDEAIKGFGLRGKWWSQKLGFALFMVIERLSDNWKNDAFGDGSRTILTLLDDALKER